MRVCRLRILSGKHEGAELPLTARRYSLGSSDDNALILSDDAIAEHHLSFFFADSELSILSAPGGLWIDGKVADTFPVDVAPFQVMTLAVSGEDNISLAYGYDASDEEAAAETRLAKKPTKPSTTKSSSTKPLSDGNLPALASAQPSALVPALTTWPDRERVVALLSSGGTSVKPKERQAEKKLGAMHRLSPQKRKVLVRSSFALGVALCVSLVVFTSTLLWLDPARRQVARMQRVEARLEKELKAKPVEERTVRIVEGEEGSILLTGYVETEKELVRLRGLAFESGLQIRVVSKEQLRAALEVIARQYGLFANFHLLAIDRNDHKNKNKNKNKDTNKDKNMGLAEGKEASMQHFHLRLEGFIDHERQLEEFRATIESDLPYIAEIETDVTTSEAVVYGLRQLLAHNAAFGGVALELEDGQLLLRGAVFADFHDELRSLLEHHYRSLPYRPQTMDHLTLVPPLQASITALLLGRQRAVDLRLNRHGSSKRYRIGELVDDDKMIVAITRNGILLSYLDQTVGFPIVTLEATQSEPLPEPLPKPLPEPLPLARTLA